MACMRKRCDKWIGFLVLSLFLLLVRVVIGWGFYQAGKGKIHNIQKPIDFFTQLHIPYPTANAWFVSYVEYIGGALMIVGLASRPVCLMLAVDMIVAYITADRAALLSLFKSQDVGTFAAAAEFWFLVGSVLVLGLGPGWFSIDGIISALIPKRKGESPPPAEKQAAGLPDRHG